MRLKILVDMNLSPSWVDRLAAAGFEAAGVLLSIDESSSRVHILPLKA